MYLIGDFINHYFIAGRCTCCIRSMGQPSVLMNRKPVSINELHVPRMNVHSYNNVCTSGEKKRGRPEIDLIVM